MSYEVGTQVDLSHLNKVVPVVATQKKTIKAATRNAYDVGTQVTFKAWRRIPVTVVA